ncbi:DNA helicase/exodeoxyribonuclease V, subunit A [Schinkia azotoformans MEV2011]|uniref:ATP-dependent helicase/nuclease subunit A n=1 Tax=Schinkia azotoformans MEV2011 TaxID=1348973 RepID=A0A072NKP5_SCHAZ|nr:helicase-exonuclease AddAB subunit AddA [Schinkia azotoformans]KEF38249.1 DNA helicase/exodeoxyribonuclease V, subunit A [Schinkia azotoformans MEV2011]MEC1693993.1 helicase-exonuclease AddAB subunit AddA [Schinkia azotoformans]MEC1725002.1 helicase-exonuclease AddAB subunit AddA [Schinkia azotoformans]MEC1769780.1 helicase-exonuclease AddAB subunit AddA [Schinkia azotoformans]MED4367060.1 helicase-exonuclease AddAB subunit AddA [Schinkia azotoformans]
MNNELKKPENSTWTDDQWRAIATSGKDILVAAAAGSGKTAVLVERIIKKITSVNNPVDVDRLLVVTFTNAAAAEMRKRIGEALEKEIAKSPSSLHLRRQLTLLNRASISTLHSFCLNVLRKYYYYIDLDPGFRIADETEAELLMEEVMEELFEEQYSLENNECFYDLVDRYSDDRSDIELQLLIRKLYDFSRSYPWPTEWLEQIVQAYDINDISEIDELSWMKDLREDIKIQLQGCRELLNRALEITKQPGGPAPYADNIILTQQLIQDLLFASEQSWQNIYEVMQTASFGKLKPCKGDEYLKTMQENVKGLREKAKDQFEKIKDELFSRKPEYFLKDIQEMKPVVETLIELVKEFSNRYEMVKKEKGIVDFADLEHFCLQILKNEMSTAGGLVPSEVAESYRDLFQEVLVDEYQDTNLVQETIIKLVSCSNNLFMVGDVKQSIYRFRLAEPHLFLTKYRLFQKEDSEECAGIRIDLSKNFRSRAEVLAGTNFIFKQIMNKTVGEIEYDDDAELKLGNMNYPESEETKAELLLIDRKDKSTEKEVNDDGDDEDESISADIAELETVQLEARVIGLKIKELIEKPYKVTDKSGNERNVTYRDIVILLRSMPWAETIMEEFKELGIPVYAELSTGYFEATEVTVMLSLLKIIDNPYQDIPLAAVLRSPIVGLTEEQLAMIRIHDKNNGFFESVKSYIRSGANHELAGKLDLFYKELKAWRTRARQGDLSELIWQLYRDTGYFDYVGGLAGGKQRQANLRALYDRSKQYEETSFRGLFRFLRFIERMQDRGEDLGTARALGEQEDVVRMMTIHKSKGLEFPIVFVAGLGRQFNMQDLRKKVLLHKELGFGSKLVNPKLRITYPTLPLLAMKRRLQMELLAEEMRVLYVALTRAKEKLYLVGTVKDMEKTMDKWNSEIDEDEWLLPDYVRAKAKCYLDWIGPALIRHPDCTVLSAKEYANEISSHSSKWEVNVLNAENFPKDSSESVKQNLELLSDIENWRAVPIESAMKNDVYHQLSWNYPFMQAQIKRSKQSVSEIKSRKQVTDAYADTALIQRFRAPLQDRPKFLQQKSLTAAEKGTAMHMVMQHIDLRADITPESLANLLASMVIKELLTEEQSTVIEIDSIIQFFETPLGQRLVKADKVRREVPFSLALPAKDAYPDWAEEDTAHVLVQGVMDCVFKDDNGVVLIDYKTDTITGRFKNEEIAKKTLEERYRLQIDLYAKALQDIWKLPSVEKYLFLFDGSLLIEM